MESIHSICVGINSLSLFEPDSNYIKWLKTYGPIIKVPGQIIKCINIDLGFNIMYNRHITIPDDYIGIIRPKNGNEKYILPPGIWKIPYNYRVQKYRVYPTMHFTFRYVEYTISISSDSTKLDLSKFIYAMYEDPDHYRNNLYLHIQKIIENNYCNKNKIIDLINKNFKVKDTGLVFKMDRYTLNEYKPSSDTTRDTDKNKTTVKSSTSNNDYDMQWYTNTVTTMMILSSINDYNCNNDNHSHDSNCNDSCTPCE